MEKENKILTGTIWKQILIFFFPILIGTFFQQLYNTVDAVIVGRFAGKLALSAVGGSSAIIINLVVGFFTGLSAGCTVLISQFYGAQNSKKLADSLHTTYAFGIIGGLVFGVLGIFLAPDLLRIMKTPEELMGLSTLYVRIYFAGLIFVFIYNMGAAVLRALGDSRMPLIFLIICTAINIVLDLVLVLGAGLGVTGVAIATLLAQAASAILVTLWLMGHTEGIKLELSEIRIHRELFNSMIKIGLPSGIQSSTYSLSNMLIQSAINAFEVNAIAGWTAEGKVDVIFWMINGSFGIAATTFVGQNFGAGRYDRVKKGTGTCLIMALTTAALVTVLLLTGGKYMLYLFTKDPEVIRYGAHMMNTIVPGYFTFVFIEIFSASLRAQGNTLIPTIINLVGICGFRAVWILTIGQQGNLDWIIYCYPASWVVTGIAMTLYYIYRRRRMPQCQVT